MYKKNDISDNLTQKLTKFIVNLQSNLLKLIFL